MLCSFWLGFITGNGGKLHSPEHCPRRRSKARPFKDAFERLPLVSDEGMKMVFEQMSDTVSGWKDLKASSFVDMRILKELDGSGFVKQLYGSK